MKNHLKNMVLSLLVILLVFAGNVAYVNALEPVDCDPGEITEEPTPLFSVRPAESTPVNDAYTIPRKMAKLSHIISTDEVYNAIMSLQSEYPEGTRWSDANEYTWHISKQYIDFSGSAAWATFCSDTAFGDINGEYTIKKYNIRGSEVPWCPDAPGEFNYSSLRPGDILCINNSSVYVIVLERYDDHIVICEGNYAQTVHWGRELDMFDLGEADYVITRYPNPPTMKDPEVTIKSITIKWENDEDATEYRIWRKAESGSWENVTTVTTAYYTDYDTVPGTYEYRIQSYIPGIEWSHYSDTVSVNNNLAPTITTAKNYGSGVLVEWDEVEGATGYVVYRRAWDKKIDDWTAFARWNNTKELKFLDTKVYEGTKYQYGIKAYYGDDPKTTTKLGPVGPMSTALIYSKKPSETTKTVTANTDEGIRVSWNKVAGATGYVIYRRAWSSTTGGWTDFQRWNNTTSTEWTDTKVYAGTRYQYGIKAYYGNDPKDMRYVGSVGPLSTNVRITTRKITSVTADGNNITVKWEGSSVFTGYQLQYATDSSFSDLKTITISNPKTVSKTFTVEDSNKTYYVRVRSFHKFEGMTYFGGWSEVKEISL